MKKTTVIFLLSILLFCLPAFFRIGQAYVRMPHESRIAAWAIGTASLYTSPLEIAHWATHDFLFRWYTSMELPFAGNLTILLSVLSMMILGPGMFALKCMYAVCSLLSLCCLFYVLSRWFDEWVGALAVLLLSVDHAFIIMTRFGGERDEILQICLLWTGLACIEFSTRRRMKFMLYLSGFVFGLALWAKMMFLGYFFAVLGVVALCGKQNRAKIALRYNLGLKDFVFWGAAFCTGCLPLIVYNLCPETFLKTFRMLLGSLLSPTRAGRNNLEVLTNIIERFKHLHFLVEHVSGYYKLYLALPFVLFFIVRALAFNRYFSRRIIIGILGAYCICFLLTSFVPIYSEPFQLLIIWPVPQIVLALFLRILYLDFRGRGNYHAMFAAFWGVVFVLFQCCQLYALSVRQTKAAFSMNEHVMLLTNESRNMYSVVDFLKTLPKCRVYSASEEVSEAGRIINEDIFLPSMVVPHDIKKPIDKAVLLVVMKFSTCDLADASSIDLSGYCQYFGPEYVEAELIYHSRDFYNETNGYVFRLSPKKQNT